MREDTIRAYTMWYGNNRFLLEGKLIIGYLLFRPDAYRVVIVSLMIIVPEAILIPTVFTLSTIWMPTLSLFLTITTLLSLFIVATKNPGYIPKQEFPFARGPNKSPTIYSTLLNEPAKSAAIERPFFEYSSNGSIIKAKYCRICFILRPPRSAHCMDCNLCVEIFDHHCPWVGTCIGKHNYRNFFLFLISTITLIIFNFIICIIRIHEASIHSRTSRDFIQDAGASIFLGIYISVFMALVGGLLSFHLYLLWTGLTTNEALKRRYYFPKNNPFKRNFQILYSIKSCFKNHFYLFNLTKVLTSENKDICNICPSEDAIKKPNSTTDFEATSNFDAALKYTTNS